jgi:hypothetical protein
MTLLSLDSFGADKYYYVGGVEPAELKKLGNCLWRSSGVNAAYDEIMNLNNPEDIWEIRVAAEYSEVMTPATRVVMDGLQSNGSASVSKVRGIYGVGYGMRTQEHMMQLGLTTAGRVRWTGTMRLVED